VLDTNTKCGLFETLPDAHVCNRAGSFTPTALSGPPDSAVTPHTSEVLTGGGEVGCEAVVEEGVVVLESVDEDRCAVVPHAATVATRTPRTTTLTTVEIGTFAWSDLLTTASSSTRWCAPRSRYPLVRAPR
jgi:hypothetical protein